MSKLIDYIIQIIKAFLDSLLKRQDPAPASSETEVVAPIETKKTEVLKPQSIPATPQHPQAIPTSMDAKLKSDLQDRAKREEEARRKAKEEIIAKLNIKTDRVSPPAQPSVTNKIATAASKVSQFIYPSKPRLWYPGALTGTKMPTQGKYPLRFPQGAIVHFTAGRFRTRENAIAIMKDGASKNLGYHYIETDGTFHQTHAFDSWTYHAGDSYWSGLGRYVHQWLTGIEIANPGMLSKKGDKYYSWYGEEFDPKNVVVIDRQELNIKPGPYVRYTEKQLQTLEAVLRFLKAQSRVFKYELVLGHDEVAPLRKNDPGAALPYPMKSLRLKLINGKPLTNKDREF